MWILSQKEQWEQEGRLSHPSKAIFEDLRTGFGVLGGQGEVIHCATVDNSRKLKNEGLPGACSWLPLPCRTSWTVFCCDILGLTIMCLLGPEEV